MRRYEHEYDDTEDAYRAICARMTRWGGRGSSQFLFAAAFARVKRTQFPGLPEHRHDLWWERWRREQEEQSPPSLDQRAFDWLLRGAERDGS